VLPINIQLSKNFPEELRSQNSETESSIFWLLTAGFCILLLLVGLGRIELPTSPLSGVRSSQLSYRPDRFKTGGAGRDRTGDLLNANQALSQLSYSPLATCSRLRPDISLGKADHSMENYRGRLDAAGRRQADPAK
jgi:hypothetical protein